MDQPVSYGQAGFLRRLGAVWIDGFVIYAAASLLLALAALLHLRISLEALFVILGTTYSVVFVARTGQTLGKMLLQIQIMPRRASSLGLGRVLVRELAGKWGLTLVLPMLLGRMFCGRAWLPTIFDLLLLMPIALLLVLYIAIAKRSWYDQLAGTVIMRAPVPAPQRKRAFVALVAVGVLALGAAAGEYAARGWLPCRFAAYQSSRSTRPYKAFLKQNHPAPVDYVLSLFDRYDIVMLCERDHWEATQWDFIFDVVRNPRFVERVGLIFTEQGQMGMQGYLDDFMATDGLPAEEVNRRVLHIQRNMGVWPRWTKTNFHTYLTRLYYFNQTLPPEKRIHHHFTDAPIDWPNFTHARYQAYVKNAVSHRDEIMGQSVIDEMRRLAAGQKTPKCLVVMNYRHGFDLTGRNPERKRMNAFEFIKDAFGDRAANVLINTRVAAAFPIAGGVWDAAFEELGNRPAGFDLAGSPFGQDPFDLFPFPYKKGSLVTPIQEFRYSDVFTGYVFTHPTKDQYQQEGIPGYYDGFETEVMRRAALIDANMEADYARTQQADILWAKSHVLPVTTRHWDYTVESYVSLAFLGIASIGLLIGTFAFLFPGRMTERPVLPRVSRKEQAWLWLIFAGGILGSVYVHELGHCIPAWMHGYRAIPTPAKEYILVAATDPAQRTIALGGILGTVLASLGALGLYFKWPAAKTSAVLSGALVTPGLYTLRFLIAGRGHDATEFQNAQAALGLSYSGHALDWFFLIALIAIAVAWLLKSRTRPGIRFLWKCLKGAALGLLLLVGLQMINNMIFDPIFGNKQPRSLSIENRPAAPK